MNAREFWLIILTSWTMEEMDALEDWARAVEATIMWSNES